MNRFHFSRDSRGLIPVALIFSLSVMVVFASCGKKADPRPPGQLPPPAVKDLTMELSDDYLTLTWTVPMGKKRVVSDFGGFLVYRSKKATTEDECKGCPILFSRIANIPIEDEEPGEAVSYSETLEKGYRYIYKVALYMEAGTVSRDSNLVKLSY